MSADGRVTKALEEALSGDGSAVERVFPIVYDELRALARSRLASERSDHTLHATALVNEAFLRMVEQRNVNWKGRSHFFAIAARAMRRILVDHARRRARAKRGGNAARITLDSAMLSELPDVNEDLIALEDALEKLTSIHERSAKVVEMRFFGGMQNDEIADVLNVSERTVRTDWSFARAFLFRELHD